MRDPSPSEPLPRLLDELLEDGAADPADDARVRAVLQTIHEQLTEGPDEVTRRRHLARAARVRRQVAARRQLGRLARTAAVAGILVFALAAAGALPDGLQRTVATAGTVVGVSLPSPSPATPAGEDADVREVGDERPPTDDEAEQSTGPASSDDEQAGTTAGAAAHADDRRLPPSAQPEAADRTGQALAEAGPAEQADERAHAAVAAGPANGNGYGHGHGEASASHGAAAADGRGQRPSHAGPPETREAKPPAAAADTRAARGPGGEGPPGHRGPRGDGPPDHAAARG